MVSFYGQWASDSIAILPFISLSSVRWRMARVMVPYPFPSLWLSHCGLYWWALGLLALV